MQDLAAGVSDVAQLRDIEHQEERDRAGDQAHDDDKRRQKASRADVAQGSATKSMPCGVVSSAMIARMIEKIATAFASSAA